MTISYRLIRMMEHSRTRIWESAILSVEMNLFVYFQLLQNNHIGGVSELLNLASGSVSFCFDHCTFLLGGNVLLSLSSVALPYLLFSISCWRSAQKSWIWTWPHDECSWQTAVKPSNLKTYPAKQTFMFQRESPF